MIPPQLGLDRKNYTKEFKADEIMYGFQSKHSVTKMDLFNISQVNREMKTPQDGLYCKRYKRHQVITHGDATNSLSRNTALTLQKEKEKEREKEKEKKKKKKKQEEKEKETKGEEKKKRKKRERKEKKRERKEKKKERKREK